MWGLAAVGVGGFGLAAVYQLSGGQIGIPCILHATTGLNCPLCGVDPDGGGACCAAIWTPPGTSTRWCWSSARSIGVAVGYQLLAWSLESLRLVRLPRLTMSPRVADWLIKGVIALLVVYGVARNLN